MDYLKEGLMKGFNSFLKGIENDLTNKLMAKIKRFERYFMIRIISAIFILIALIFLSIAATFLLIEYFKLSIAFSFLIIGIILLMIGLILKLR